ncbi:MAG: undecaprenyldiphospho-muramoylpentapeptide beta-N-acetylglucosaminyltransferase [Thermodesulfobacteriota bacterium]|nr:undecaprenyldiphospho-muramoylpentapeptide beta-N-acetylglucosaminyltransferase [Thermodesulfobacteriota bacterium]
MSYCRIIIAGGGTGGHLFPGIAVAMELEKRSDKAEILFLVGRRGLGSEIVARYGYGVAPIDVEGLKGRGWKRGVSVLVKLPRSVFQSASIIKKVSPALVLGMGGYAAGPVCLSARLMGIPTAIHEQNSYPGLTNRLLSRFVDRAFISFEESRVHFKGRAVLLTGTPVRDELFSGRGLVREERKKFTVLIVGGSQGARAINEAFAAALVHLKSRGRILDVIHQTGETDYARVLEDYRNRGVQGQLIPFIEDMTTAYNRANLVVSRAGATTIFELAALGKPCILIPYPYSTNQHQEINARCLARAGAAHMIRQSDLTGEGMAHILMKYMDDRSALYEMGRRAREMGRRDAAKVIADQLAEMVKA